MHLTRACYVDNVRVDDRDFDWSEIRRVRASIFLDTDLWYLKDRWDNLSTTAKGQLNAYRQALRDLPQTYSDPNEAVDNWPVAPDE